MTTRVIWAKGLPPSLNELYENAHRFNRKTKRRVSFQKLSDEGVAYKQRFVTQVIPKHMQVIREVKEILEDPNIVAEVTIQVIFSSLTTKGWPKRAKNRFRVVDADNRGKITFDCLKEALGVDDSMYFRMSEEKHEGENEGVRLLIDFAWCTKYGIPEVPYG